ncbi:hypothetical protein [Streptomyces sp. NPDC101150]|uniref:hypothetical protein n=1 Tax=Streptomyces sp. NPDC101150 TaxID=3366114 RepID=UPI00382D63C0
MTATGEPDRLDLLRRAADGGQQAAARELGHRLGLLDDAVILQRPDEVPEAERWLRRALELDPGDAVAGTLLAGLLGRQCESVVAGQPWEWSDEAAADDEEPEDPWLRALRERLREGERILAAILAADPDNATAASGLALVAAGRADIEDYIADCFGDSGPDEEDEASGGTDDGEGEEADDGPGGDAVDRREYWCRRALSVNGDDTAAAGVLAAVLEERGETQEAAGLWGRLVELNPQDYWAAFRLVMTRGDTPGAERASREPAAAGDPQAVLTLALLLDATGRETEADDWLARPTAYPMPHSVLPRDTLGLHHRPLPALELARSFQHAEDLAGARRWAGRAVRQADDKRRLIAAVERYAALLKGADDDAGIREFLEAGAAAGQAAAAFALMTWHRVLGHRKDEERWRSRGQELLGSS